MHFFKRLITVFAKVFGLHSRPAAATPSDTPPVTLTIEKSAVAVVGGGRRPARLRGKAVRLTCVLQVTDHDGDRVTLRRSGEVPNGVDDILYRTTARIKKLGAGRRPANLEGVSIRLMTTWTVREDYGDRVVLQQIAA
ncbi:MAG: hypothetical protein ACK5ZR_10350 [Gemmatimonadaceae bacterium]